MYIMKKNIKITALIIFILNIITFSVNAQSNYMFVNAVINDNSEMNSDAKTYLENKLNQVIIKNSLIGNQANARFIILANPIISSKDVLGTAPTTVAMNIELTFYFGDGIEGNKFSSYTMNLKGVDNNETKAYIAAFKNIKADDQGLAKFIEDGKSGIIRYYNSQCSQIISKAKSLQQREMYDEALNLLSSVPEACTQCYNQASPLLQSVYSAKVDYDCKKILNEANMLWNANQDSYTANTISKMFSNVSPKAKCISEIKQLGNRISAKIKEIDKREWDYVFAKDIELEKDKIKAIRDIGVAYGNGQPKTIVYNYKGW